MKIAVIVCIMILLLGVKGCETLRKKGYALITV